MAKGGPLDVGLAAFAEDVRSFVSEEAFFAAQTSPMNFDTESVV